MRASSTSTSWAAVQASRTMRTTAVAPDHPDLHLALLERLEGTARSGLGVEVEDQRRGDLLHVRGGAGLADRQDHRLALGAGLVPGAAAQVGRGGVQALAGSPGRVGGDAAREHPETDQRVAVHPRTELGDPRPLRRGHADPVREQPRTEKNPSWRSSPERCDADAMTACAASPRPPARFSSPTSPTCDAPSRSWCAPASTTSPMRAPTAPNSATSSPSDAPDRSRTCGVVGGGWTYRHRTRVRIQPQPPTTPKRDCFQRISAVRCPHPVDEARPQPTQARRARTAPIARSTLSAAGRTARSAHRASQGP